MPVAVPLIMAGASIGSSYLGRSKTPPGMAQAQRSQQVAGQELTGIGTPLLKSAGSYYDRLLHGDKAGLTSALSPEISSITQLYTGANRTLDRGPAGPGRDVAHAELNRQRVGQIGQLFPQARASAASGAMTVGSAALSAGQGAFNTSNSIYDTLLRGQYYSDQRSEGLGKALGPLLVDFYKAMSKRTPGTTRTQTGLPSIGPAGGGFGLGPTYGAGF